MKTITFYYRRIAAIIMLTALSTTAFAQAGLLVTPAQTISGSISGNTNFNQFEISSDTAEITGSNSFGNGWTFNYIYGGSGFLGNRNGLLINAFKNGASTNPAGSYTAALFQNSASVGDGGSAGAELGAVFGFSAFPKISGSNNFFLNLSNEVNWANQDATTRYVSGLALVTHNSHSEHASIEETMLHFGAQTGALGMDNAITLSAINGQAPLTSSGVILKTIGSATIQDGIDLSSYTITGNFLKGPNGFSVTGAGDIAGSNFTSGTWTPTLSFGGGSTGITYNTRAGSYVKLGKLIVAEYAIALTAKGASTGAAQIAGLPTASANTSTLGVVTVGFYSGMSSATGIGGYLGASSTTFTLQVPGAAAIATAADTNFTDASSMTGTVIYITP